MIVLGIDPGKTGGVVAIADGRVVKQVRAEQYVHKTEYVPADMRLCLDYDSRIGLVVLERQHAMPGQGVTSMFSVGLGFGLWWGIIAALRLPLERVSAQTWQKAVLHGVTGGDSKDRAIRVARDRLPDLCLTPGKVRTPHAGLADAACMALYGLTRTGWGFTPTETSK